MAEVVFVYPVLLWLLLLLPLLLALFVWAERSRVGRMRQIGQPELLALLMRQVSMARRWWKSGLWLLCMAMMLVALARPTWGIRTDTIETSGASVFVLMDVSNSMNAEDLSPSRLERARLGAQDLMNGIQGNEVGLITFAGTAFVYFPLTTDVQSAQSFLNFVSTDVITQQGTAIGEAVQLALNSFDEVQATEKIIVLFSDGENHSTETEQAIQAAIEADVTVHVLGYGTESGGSIPIRNSLGQVVGNKLDRTGNIIITRLDEQVLQEIARRTDGLYQQIDPSGVAIENVIRLINTAEGGTLGEDERVIGIERYALFAAIALLFLSLEMLLPETKTN
ncbi:MAG: VWA domain-containing protein [Chloroflexota bacterium]